MRRKRARHGSGELSAKTEKALDEIFGGPPADFIKGRDALAKKLKDEGDADESKRVKALRKPSKAASVVNSLAARGPKAGQALPRARGQAPQGDVRKGRRQEDARAGPRGGRAPRRARRQCRKARRRSFRLHARPGARDASGRAGRLRAWPSGSSAAGSSARSVPLRWASTIWPHRLRRRASGSRKPKAGTKDDSSAKKRREGEGSEAQAHRGGEGGRQGGEGGGAGGRA